jgi:hypothetical protein
MASSRLLVAVAVGFCAAVVFCGVLSVPVAVQVSGNNFILTFPQADPFSPSPSPLHLASAQDLHLPRPTTTATRLRLAPGQAAADDTNPVHHRHPHIWRSFGESVLPRDLTPSDICYYRQQISTQFLVVRCVFTTSSVDPLSTDALRGLHPGVCNFGAPATPTDELAVVNTMDVSVSIRSLDLLVIQSSFEDCSVIWLLNL